MINKKRLIKLTQQLIRINSENPPGREKEIAQFLQAYLRRLGLEAKIYEFKKGRANLVAAISAAGRGKTLLITPHLDTVPAGKSWSRNPFGAAVKKNRIYGLGATDCKGNLAVAVEALNSLLEEKRVLDYNLVFAATADEECGSNLGLAAFLKKGILRPDAAVVLDADDFNIIVAQKGLLQIKVKIEGRRAHAAYPERGVNAIDKAIAIIRRLKGNKFAYPRNKYLKSPTVNTGTIRGGDKVNIVADWCEFELDFRFLPGMASGDLLRRIKKVIGSYTKDYRLEIEGLQQPYSLKRGHPLVLGLKKAMRKFKLKPEVKGSEGATVITFFKEKGVPAVATGFGCSGCAHVSDEFADTGRLYKGALVLEEFLKESLWKE